MRRTASIFITILAIAALAVAQQPIDERVAASHDGTVEIENLAGSVTVTGSGGDKVLVSGTLGRGAERCEVTSRAGNTRIRVVLPEQANDVDGTDLEIQVPGGSSLEIETVSANISVSGVSGGMELQSISGEITLSGTPEELEAATVSGNISVETAPSGAEIASVSGSIAIREVRDELEVGSVSGNISILGGALESAEMETTSGSISCAVDLFGSGEIEMDTMSGTVELIVPAAVAGDFEISTFSGSITNEIGPAPQEKSGYSPGQELEFSTGGGGTRVSMSSFSGSVKLIAR